MLAKTKCICGPMGKGEEVTKTPDACGGWMRSKGDLRGHMAQHCGAREGYHKFEMNSVGLGPDLVKILVYTGDCYRGPGGPQRGGNQTDLSQNSVRLKGSRLL